VLINQKTNLDTFKGIKKGVLKKLAAADIVRVADYLGTKKFVLVDELDLTGDEINSISAVVNTFISRNDEPEEVVVEETPAEEQVEEVAIEEEVVADEAPAEEKAEEEK
jgi:hypothetical protein